MAANTLANIAAATAAGYGLERTTRIDGRNVTRLKKFVSGLPGQKGQEQVFEGEGASSGAADTVSLANLNAWRNQRYGATSGVLSASSIPDAAASPSTQGIAPTHRALVKDRD